MAENTSTITLDTQAGKAYYIWQEVKMGMWIARTLLRRWTQRAAAKVSRSANGPSPISDRAMSAHRDTR